MLERLSKLCRELRWNDLYYVFALYRGLMVRGANKSRPAAATGGFRRSFKHLFRDIFKTGLWQLAEAARMPHMLCSGGSIC